MPVLCAFVLFSSVSFSPLTDHAHAAQAQRQLPELLYTCPMHPDQLHETKGICPICKMQLDATRIEPDFWYSCPLHPVALRPTPGICPIDKRPLMPVTVTVHWTCNQTPDQKLTEPGRCADGSARHEVHAIRAHGDHNPRHGGQFYMASDLWHHLEGTYPRVGVFRVYFYDNFTQPIDVKDFTGRIVTREEFDSATNTTKELESFPLRPGRDNILEAPLKNDTLPLKVSLKVNFTKDSPEQRFDFTEFQEYSKEPASPPTTTTTAATINRPASRPSPAATTTSSAAKPAPGFAPATTTTAGATAGQAAPKALPMPEQAPAPPAQSAVTVAPAIETITNCEPNMMRTDVLLLSDALPKNSKALLNLLDMCGAEVQKLIEGRQFGFIYQPTMLGKDIALALEGHVIELPEPRRVQAADGIRRTVLSAWQLDMYGDLGNQERLSEAYNLFAAAVAAIKSAYAANP